RFHHQTDHAIGEKRVSLGVGQFRLAVSCSVGHSAPPHCSRWPVSAPARNRSIVEMRIRSFPPRPEIWTAGNRRSRTSARTVWARPPIGGGGVALRPAGGQSVLGGLPWMPSGMASPPRGPPLLVRDRQT